MCYYKCCTCCAAEFITEDHKQEDATFIQINIYIQLAHSGNKRLNQTGIMLGPAGVFLDL